MVDAESRNFLKLKKKIKIIAEFSFKNKLSIAHLTVA